MDSKTLISETRPSPQQVLTGFSCSDSSELQSPRSGVTTRSNSSQLHTRSSPVSLLSVLLSNSAQLQSHAWEDDHMCDEDDDDCMSDGDEPEGRAQEHGSESQLGPLQRESNATGVPAGPTAPMNVPSVMWLKEASAVQELRRMHYERCMRRIELENAAQREAAMRAHAQQRATAQQHQAYHHHHQQVQQGVMGSQP